MKPKPYSLWDTLADTRLSWKFFFGATPTALRAERCRVRIGPFEDSASAAASGKREVPRVGPGSSQDLRERRRWFDSHLYPDAPAGSGNTGCADFADFLWFAPDDIVAILVLLVIGVLFGAVLLPLVWLPVWIVRFRRRRRCRAAMSHRQCPDCGQDLTGCPPAIKPAYMDSMDVGPRVCPECAAPWPLLPPTPRGRRRE